MDLRQIQGLEIGAEGEATPAVETRYQPLDFYNALIPLEAG